MKLYFFQSKNINQYKTILEKMVDVWEHEHYSHILEYCEIIETDYNLYWEIWLIQNEKYEVIGICGLYSLRKDYEELWLSWLGLIPEYRNNNLGDQILNFIENKAKEKGTKRLLSYVGEDGDALNFYYKHGYQWGGSVEKYIKEHPDVKNEFGNIKDFIIYKDL